MVLVSIDVPFDGLSRLGGLDGAAGYMAENDQALTRDNRTVAFNGRGVNRYMTGLPPRHL